MAAITSTARPLEIGRLIRDLFDVLGRNFATYFVLALILVGGPSLLVYLFYGHPARFGVGASLSGGLGASVGVMIRGIASLVLQAALIYAAVNDLNGRKTSAADSLRRGLHAFLPILAISILMGLGIGFGFLLLIVPGVMLACAWCVAVPAYVVEKIDLMRAFGRSAELTRGNRWAIFGLLVLLSIFSLIVGLVAAVPGAIFGFLGLGHVVFALFMSLNSAVTGMVSAVGAAVLYFELRRLKDGVSVEGLASVFD